MNFPFEGRFIHHLTLCQNPAYINIDLPSQIHRIWSASERILTFSNSFNDPDTMPKPGIKEHRLYLLKFAEFDPPLKGFLPSLILSMTLTLCQNPASMNIDFAFSNLTEINPCWKRFIPSQIHRLWPTLERILTFWCSQNSIHLLQRMLNFSNLQNWIHLRKDSYPDTKPNPASMKIEIHLLKFTEFDPAWKGFLGG